MDDNLYNEPSKTFPANLKFPVFTNSAETSSNPPICCLYASYLSTLDLLKNILNKITPKLITAIAIKPTGVILAIPSKDTKPTAPAPTRVVVTITAPLLSIKSKTLANIFDIEFFSLYNFVSTTTSSIPASLNSAAKSLLIC